MNLPPVPGKPSLPQVPSKTSAVPAIPAKIPTASPTKPPTVPTKLPPAPSALPSTLPSAPPALPSAPPALPSAPPAKVPAVATKAPLPVSTVPSVSIPSTSVPSKALPPASVPVPVRAPSPSKTLPPPPSASVPASVPSPSKTLPPPPSASVPANVPSPSKTLPPPPSASVPVRIPSPTKTVSPIKAGAPVFVPTKIEVSPVDENKIVKDPRQYIDTYFGKRNGIAGTPAEGVNYTLETLTYMTSHNRADQITDILVKKMGDIAKEEGKIGNTFEIFECCAGLGGNTMSFLDNKNISHVTTFEINDKRRTMLKNNLAMYKLDDPSRVTIGDGAFPGVPKCEPGRRILHYQDPPWTLVKGHEAQKEDYILEGMKVGDKTLEEIVAACSHCDLIAMRVPPGYKLKPVEGFKYEEVLIKNSLLIMVRPVKKAPCKEEIEKYSAFVQAQKAKEREEEIIWEGKLKEYLRYTLLPRCVSADSALDKLVSPEAMEIWKVAFTHESFDPNVGKNYEEEELYGDSVLEMCYIKFIRQKYPQFNRSQLSELRTYYLAKGFQSGLAYNLGAGAYLRTRYRKSIHMYEDVIESFIGALDRVGDLVFRFGAGAGLCYNMVLSLYGDVEVDIEKTTKNPKTQIKEVFERLGFINAKAKEKVPEEVISNEENRTVTVRILIPDLGVSILKQLGVDIKNKVIAESTERTKKVATDSAYVNALEHMNSLGITSDFVDQFAKLRDLQNPEIYPYVLGVQDRLKSEGFEGFYFVEDRAGGGAGGEIAGKYIQMIGYKPDGYKEVLVMTENPVESSIEGKQNLLLRYKNYSP